MQHDLFQTPTHTKHQKTSEKVTLWVKPAVKAELKRLAGMDGLTVSKTGATLLGSSHPPETPHPTRPALPTHH